TPASPKRPYSIGKPALGGLSGVARVLAFSSARAPDADASSCEVDSAGGGELAAGPERGLLAPRGRGPVTAGAGGGDAGAAVGARAGSGATGGGGRGWSLSLVCVSEGDGSGGSAAWGGSAG